MRFVAVIMALLCVSAGGPPMPPLATKPRKPKAVALSPRDVTTSYSVVRMAVVAPPPLVTNGIIWTQMMPWTGSGHGDTVPLGGPRWLTLDRFNTVSHLWTNVYDGALTNGTYQFNSITQKGVAPSYRFTVEFKNAK